MSHRNFVRIDLDEHGHVDLVTLLDSASLPEHDELSALPLTTTLWEVSSHADGSADVIFDPARSKTYRDDNLTAFDRGDDNLLSFYNTTEYVQLRVIEGEFIRRRVLNAHVGTVRPGVMGLLVPDGDGEEHGFYVTGHSGHTWHHRSPKGDIRVVVDSETDAFSDERALVGLFFQALGF